MKNKIIFLLSIITLGLAGCSKKFLDDMKSYDKYDESIFTNETQTGWYVDRMYNYFFVNYRSPIQTMLAVYNDDRSRSTEEMGGTITDLTNPNKTFITAAQANDYFGGAKGVLDASTNNYPYTRIRFSNFLIERIDEFGQGLSATFRDRAKGQMYYFRAVQYFELVRLHGGVPLVTTVENASADDETIRHPRATASQCFEQIVKDLDSAARMLPMKWEQESVDYGRITAAGALAMKSRVLLTAASPLYNTDWDNSGNKKWQDALTAGLDAETRLSAAGYGLFGTNAKDWGEMTIRNDNKFNMEALIVQLLSPTNSSTAVNSPWENSIRPLDQKGGGGYSVPKGMLDLFPLADGRRPTTVNGYVDTFFFENRDPRFYRTFAFSGAKWPIKTNAQRTSWFYRWRPTSTSATYYGGNTTSSPALVRKMSNPAADTTALAFSGTDVFEYRYAELLLNIAECYAAQGNTSKCVEYLGKIRQRVGINSADNYGLGTLGGKYAAIEACLYERRVELAYEGKRFWDVHRWVLYDNIAEFGNTCAKLGLAPLNGTNRTGYYWQAKTGTTDPLTAADRNSILVDPDAADFTTQIGKLKDLVRAKFVMTALDNAMDRDAGQPVNILFRQNYYISGLRDKVLATNPWLLQTKGWQDANGAPGTFDWRQ